MVHVLLPVDKRLGAIALLRRIGATSMEHDGDALACGLRSARRVRRGRASIRWDFNSRPEACSQRSRHRSVDSLSDHPVQLPRAIVVQHDAN